MKKKILLFGFHDFGSSMAVYNLTEGMKPLGVKVQKVAKEDYLSPLGVLAGAVPVKNAHAKESQTYEGEDLSVRMLLFAGITQEELEQELEVCKHSGITTNDLKALLTPYNMAWNAVSLCRELMKEHAVMNGDK